MGDGVAVNRGATAAAVMLGLAACSQPAPSGQTPPPEPASAPTGVAAPPTAPPSTGGGLTGEVTSLSGEVTPFQVTVTDTATIVDLAADVLFAFDSADLSAEAPTQLRRAADLIAEGGVGDIRIIGHTDAMGEDAYNLDLSTRRARSVATWMTSEAGLAADRLVAEGRGEAEPVAPNVTPAGADDARGRALNRRVQIVIPRA